jgi:hypothetical protein
MTASVPSHDCIHSVCCAAAGFYGHETERPQIRRVRNGLLDHRAKDLLVALRGMDRPYLPSTDAVHAQQLADSHSGKAANERRSAFDTKRLGTMANFLVWK